MSSAPSEGPVLNKHDLGMSLGAIEIGIMLSCILYGNLVVQFYVYNEGTKDRLWLKASVACCFFLETLHSILLLVYFYEISVTNYGSPEALETLSWAFSASVPPQAFAGAIVQAIYSYRIYAISGNLWLAIPGWLAEVLRVALSLFITVATAQSGLWPKFVSDYGWAVIFTMINSAVIDWFNSVLLCYILRSRCTGYKKTSAMLNKLILFSIETGVCTSVIALLLVAFLIHQPHNGIWQAMYVVYTKVYLNSLLVMLNSRDRIREIGHGTQSIGLGAITVGSPQFRPSGINVDVETVRFDDADKNNSFSARAAPSMRSTSLEEDRLKRTIA